MTWIALTTAPNKARAVRKRLRRRGESAYIPAMVSKRIIPKGTRTRRKRFVTVLMSYVLVRAPEHIGVRALWLYGVLSVKDVSGVLHAGDDPAWIPDHAIEELRAEVARMVLETSAARHRRWLRKGGKAVVKSGSLAGRVGTVQWVTAKRVGLEARLFGAARVIAVDRENIEAAC